MAIKGLEQAVENLSRISRTAVPGAAAMAIMPPVVMSVHRAVWLTAGRRRPGRLSRITMW